MSFDLVIWDADRPPTVGDAATRYEQGRAGHDPVDRPSERVSAFSDECDRRWPAEEEDGEPPFVARRTPSAYLVSARHDAATTLYGELAEMAERHGLILFDPQSGIIKIPSRLSFESEPPQVDRVNRPPLRRLLRRRKA